MHNLKPHSRKFPTPELVNPKMEATIEKNYTVGRSTQNMKAVPSSNIVSSLEPTHTECIDSGIQLYEKQVSKQGVGGSP